jgi:hypothetical protein
MKTRQRVRVLVTVAVAFVLVSTGVTSAQAATPPSPDATPEQVHSQYTTSQLLLNQTPSRPATASGDSLTAKGAQIAASFSITCTVSVESPHISSTAGLGVIFKSRVTCVGTGSYPAKATIRVRSGLFYDAATSPSDTSNVNFVQVKTNDETRTVNVNGTANTFYTPPLGQNGAHGCGNYDGTTTVAITVPTGQTTGSATSNIVFLYAT